MTVTVAKPTSTNYVKGNELYLDGIRVINPMNTSSNDAGIATDAYAADGESDMTVVTLRNKMINDSTDGTGYFGMTDSNGNLTSRETYANIGPNEELYLPVNCSVTFSFSGTGWDSSKNHLYLGIKAPMGETGNSVSINNNSVSITNTVDCYYEIASYASYNSSSVTYTYTITNTGTGVISLTNIKATGNPDFKILTEKDIEVEDSENDNTETTG